MNKQYEQNFGIAERDESFLFENVYLGDRKRVSFDVPKGFLNEGKVKELMAWLEEQRK